jgi:hypothetical protein
MHVHAVLVPHPDPVVGHIVTNHQARRTIRTCDTKKQVNPFLPYGILYRKKHRREIPRTSLYNKDLSNKTTFSLIHLAGQYHLLIQLPEAYRGRYCREHGRE